MALTTADIDTVIITGTGGGDAVSISDAGVGAFGDTEDFAIDLAGRAIHSLSSGSAVDTITFTPFEFNGADMVHSLASRPSR